MLFPALKWQKVIFLKKNPIFWCFSKVRTPNFQIRIPKSRFIKVFPIKFENGQNRQKPLINTWTIWYFWTLFLKSYSGKRSKIALFSENAHLCWDFFSKHSFFTFLSILEIFRNLKCHRQNLKKCVIFLSSKIFCRG